MQYFPENIKFKYPWRKYQEKVLLDLEFHLSDNHLHVIAPPGSGKTVLGLEVALRLNKPTLILTPTLAIRNQWIQRFVELFLQTDKTPEWISNSIKNPKFLTVSTYQGLHMAFTSREEEANEELMEDEENNSEPKSSQSKSKSILKRDEIINKLLAINIKTVVIDEAHHLKNEWWKTLDYLKNKIQPTIVGLTATPPYDVSYQEWHRYQNINGPVDTEISVPELIQEEAICPHHDFVYLSHPTEKEKSELDNIKTELKQLIEGLNNDTTFISGIKSHPFFTSTENHLEEIYGNISNYSSMIIFLKNSGELIDKRHLNIYGVKNYNIPPFSLEWLETLLTFYLIKEPKRFVNMESHQKSLEKRLKRLGLLEKKQINIKYNKNIHKLISFSLSKLQSIQNIVSSEYNYLENNLRMVILTDYIRKEYLTDKKENNLTINKIGVLPIFETLRRNNQANIRLGVLTGSIIIIPAISISAISKYQSQLKIEKLPYDENYILIKPEETVKHQIVQLITHIFQEGEIEVLVGTKSLLGEGWDAPAINSLILASFVGSFVLSNQMRGRAIRTMLNDKEKTSNVWHLACVDPNEFNGGNDFQMLDRRFKSFVGISNNSETSIENGISRLHPPESNFTKESINVFNAKMIKISLGRPTLKERWKNAISTGKTLIEEIKIPFPKEQNYQIVKTLYFNRTIAGLFAMLGGLLLSFGGEFLANFLPNMARIRSEEHFVTLLFIIGILLIIIVGPLTFHSFRMFIKYRDIAKDIHLIGESLLSTLISLQKIKTDPERLKIVTQIDKNGAVFCHLDGGTNFEKSLFINSLTEIIYPIDNPRYIIIRKSSLFKIINQKDYHSVPEEIGKYKNTAEKFVSYWKRFVGNCELIYTRNPEGRKLLVKAKSESLSAQFEDEVEHVNIWK